MYGQTRCQVGSKIPITASWRSLKQVSESLHAFKALIYCFSAAGASQPDRLLNNLTFSVVLRN